MKAIRESFADEAGLLEWGEGGEDCELNQSTASLYPSLVSPQTPL